MAYYGIDLHSDSFTCAKIENKNRMHDVKEFRSPLYGERFNYFLSNLTKDDVILIEATTQSYWFYDQVKDRVKACYVLNSNKLDSAYMNKTDKIDARKLLILLVCNELARIDPTERPYIYVPDQEIREIRGFFTTYKLQTKMSTQTKNRIHSIFKQNGIVIDKARLNTRKYRIRLRTEEKLSTEWKVQVVSLMNSLTTLEAEKKQLKEIIIYKGYKKFGEDIKRLMSIKGISSFSATALLADICTVDRFKNAKKFCCYLRTTPKVKSSNKKIYIGKINKQGRTLTCSLLTESVMHLTNSSSHIKNFKERIKKGKHSGTVRMAVIRKILTAAYHMLKKKELYYWVETECYERKLQELNKIVYKYDKLQANVEQKKVS